MDRPVFTRDRAVRSILVLSSFAAAAGAVWLSSGMTDTVFAVAVAAVGVGVALLTTSVYGVTLHHLGTVAVIDQLSFVSITLLQVAAVFLLVSDTPLGDRIRTGLLLVPTILLLGSGTVVVAETSGIAVATVGVVCVLGIGVYAFHRLTIVRLGLASTEADA